MSGEINSSVAMRRLKAAETQVAALEVKIASIERALPNIAKAVQQTFAQLGDEVARITAVLDAVTQTIGQDQVQAKLDEIAQQQQDDMVRETKENMARSLASGAAEEIPEVTADCTVIGVSVDAEGTELPPYYVQFPMNLAPEWAQGLLGKPAGTKIEQPDGTFLIVQSIVRATGKQIAPPAPAADEAAEPAAAEVGGQGG